MSTRCPTLCLDFCCSLLGPDCTGLNPTFCFDLAQMPLRPSSPRLPNVGTVLSQALLFLCVSFSQHFIPSCFALQLCVSFPLLFSKSPGEMSVFYSSCASHSCWPTQTAQQILREWRAWPCWWVTSRSWVNVSEKHSFGVFLSDRSQHRVLVRKEGVY